MSVHKSVLFEESIDALRIKSGDIVVDATLGGGGHSSKILEIIGDSGKLIAIDRDKNAIESFKIKTKEKDNVILVHENFRNLDRILSELEIEKVDGILADFGLSSDQLDSEGRGFSFLKDSSLDMRMNLEGEKTAEEVVNKYDQEDLERIFRNYGEEKFSKKIAKKIIESRKGKEIKTTSELVDVIKKAIPERFQHGKIHPATRIFQAIRIEVNQELESINDFTEKAIGSLKPEGRLAVISFHSGEDRIVKNIFKDKEKECICPPQLPICQCDKISEVKIITRKPIIPSNKEVEENPRARSAKLRIIEKK